MLPANTYETKPTRTVLMLKRGYIGTYHQMSVKYLDRYIEEFAGRHNQRPLDTLEQMERIAQGFVGKHLPYGDLIAA